MANKMKPKGRGGNAPASFYGQGNPSGPAPSSTSLPSFGLPDAGMPKQQSVHDIVSQLSRSTRSANPGVDTHFTAPPLVEPPDNPVSKMITPYKTDSWRDGADYLHVSYSDGSSKILDGNGRTIPYDVWQARRVADRRKAQQKAPQATQKPAGMSDFDWDTRIYGKPAVRNMVNGVTYAQYHNKDGSLSLPVFYGGDADKQTGLYGNRLPSSDPRIVDIAGATAWNEYRFLIDNPIYKNDPAAQNRANQIRNSAPFKNYVKRRTQANYQSAKTQNIPSVNMLSYIPVAAKDVYNDTLADINYRQENNTSPDVWTNATDTIAKNTLEGVPRMANGVAQFLGLDRAASAAQGLYGVATGNKNLQSQAKQKFLNQSMTDAGLPSSQYHQIADPIKTAANGAPSLWQQFETYSADHPFEAGVMSIGMFMGLMDMVKAGVETGSAAIKAGTIPDGDFIQSRSAPDVYGRVINHETHGPAKTYIVQTPTGIKKVSMWDIGRHMQGDAADAIVSGYGEQFGQHLGYKTESGRYTFSKPKPSPKSSESAASEWEYTQKPPANSNTALVKKTTANPNTAAFKPGRMSPPAVIVPPQHPSQPGVMSNRLPSPNPSLSLNSGQATRPQIAPPSAPNMLGDRIPFNKNNAPGQPNRGLPQSVPNVPPARPRPNQSANPPALPNPSNGLVRKALPPPQPPGSTSPPISMPPRVPTIKAPAKAGAFSVGPGNANTPGNPPPDIVKPAVEGAFRNDLGDHGAEAFTRNLAQHDPSGNVTRKLTTGEPLNPGDHLAISRAYHDSLPIDIRRPPSPKTANTINHIVRDYSIFSRRMPGGAEAASHPLVTALHKNLGTAATENLFRRASGNMPLFNTIDKIYRGEPLTPLDTRILGHNFESIAKANNPNVAAEIGRRAEKAAVGVWNRNIAATKVSLPRVQKTKPAQSAAVAEPSKQKEKIQPLTLLENASARDIDKVDAHSRANSTKVPEQGSIITPKGKIVRFDKSNGLDMNTTNECIGDICNDNYVGAHGKPYSAYKNLEQCIRDSANIRKLVQNTKELKNLFKTAAARNICSFYIKDYNAGTASMPYKLTKKIGISGNPKEVGGFEKQYENDGVLQSAPYDKNNPGVFNPGMDKNGFLKDTCAEWKFVQWFLKTYPDLSKVNCEIWFYPGLFMND